MEKNVVKLNMYDNKVMYNFIVKHIVRCQGMPNIHYIGKDFIGMKSQDDLKQGLKILDLIEYEPIKKIIKNWEKNNPDYRIIYNNKMLLLTYSYLNGSMLLEYPKYIGYGKIKKYKDIKREYIDDYIDFQKSLKQYCIIIQSFEELCNNIIGVIKKYSLITTTQIKEAIQKLIKDIES